MTQSLFLLLHVPVEAVLDGLQLPYPLAVTEETKADNRELLETLRKLPGVQVHRHFLPTERFPHPPAGGIPTEWEPSGLAFESPEPLTVALLYYGR